MQVLQTVLDQAEQERTKRIQLERQVAQLVLLAKTTRQRLQQQQQTPTTPTTTITRNPSCQYAVSQRPCTEHHATTITSKKEIMALQTQVQGYRQLVETITHERPAIAAAMLRKERRQRLGQQSNHFENPYTNNHRHNNILPTNIVRLLEILPWHPVAQAHVVASDAVYEWQRFDTVEQVWKSDLQSFPSFFNALPVTSSPHEEEDDDVDDDDDASDDDDDDDEFCPNDKDDKDDDDDDDDAGSCSDGNSVAMSVGREIAREDSIPTRAKRGGDNWKSEKSNSSNHPRCTMSHYDTTTATIARFTRRDSMGDTSDKRNNHNSKTGSSSFDFSSFLAGLLPSRLSSSQHNHQHPQQERVLTNANLTTRYALAATNGFPLPNPKVSGTWKWIGRWVIDKSTIEPDNSNKNATNASSTVPQNNSSNSNPLFLQAKAHNTKKNHDTQEPTQMETAQDKCDSNGWTYALEASHFVLWNSNELCWGASSSSCSCECPTSDKVVPATCPTTKPGMEESSLITNPTRSLCPTTDVPALCRHCQRRSKPVLRRRKWTRQRVLVDYPMASKSSQEFLRLLAHNASMELAVQELDEKLQETMEAMEQADKQYESLRGRNSVQVQQFQRCWETQEECIKQLRFGKFKRKIEELTCTQDDILPIIANPVLFWKLQQALRQSGAITNAMLQQGIHFYIQDHVRTINNHKPTNNIINKSVAAPVATLNTTCGRRRPSNHSSPAAAITSTRHDLVRSASQNMVVA